MTAPATTRDEEFSDFVEQHRGSLQHVAYLLTGDEYRAEDLLQDALVKTWLAWKGIDATYAWAYTRRVMVNLMTDRWRRKRYEPVLGDESDRRADLRSESAFSVVDDQAWLVAQLTRLTPRERAMIVLRYVEDLPEAEVADLLKVSVGTVKSTCSRTLAKLRPGSSVRSES